MFAVFFSSNIYIYHFKKIVLVEGFVNNFNAQRLITIISRKFSTANRQFFASLSVAVCDYFNFGLASKFLAGKFE